MTYEIINKEFKNFKLYVKKPAFIANERELKVVNNFSVTEGLTFDSVEIK